MSEIRHVSDTALMVAACRALETARPDGIVRDPYAERLAGARGAAILQGMSGWRMICFGVAVRTRFLDELVMEAIAVHGVRTVLCAGAGLDTRPYRLDLPPDLRWIEVDLPDMIAYKSAAMAAETPRCRLERVAADLTDPRERRAVLAEAGMALLITEGLLMYLPGETVEALASESPAHYWLLDASSLDLARRMGVDALGAIQSVRAAGHLSGFQVLDVVRRHGWSVLRHRSYARDSREVAAERIRAMTEPYRAAGIPIPEAPVDETSGVYLLVSASSARSGCLPNPSR